MSEVTFDGSQMSVRLDAASTKALRNIAAGAYPLETGGLLIGRYVDGHVAVVQMVTGPAPDGAQGARAFERGREGFAELLERLWVDGLYYLGEWHTHPAANPIPSEIDADTMREIASDPAYKCPEPVLVILGGIPCSDTERWSATIFRCAQPPLRLAA